MIVIYLWVRVIYLYLISIPNIKPTHDSFPQEWFIHLRHESFQAWFCWVWSLFDGSFFFLSFHLLVSTSSHLLRLSHQNTDHCFVLRLIITWLHFAKASNSIKYNSKSKSVKVQSHPELESAWSREMQSSQWVKSMYWSPNVAQEMLPSYSTATIQRDLIESKWWLVRIIHGSWQFVS